MSLVAIRNWRHFALIVLIASVARGGVLLVTHDSLSADPDAYRRIAHCVAIHGTFGLTREKAGETVNGESVATPTAFRPPLYPWLLSWLADGNGNVANFAVALVHWILGTATAAGTYLVARNLLRDQDCREASRRVEIAAMMAAGLVAIDPLLLQASSLVMTETLAAFLVVVVLWHWSQLIGALGTGNSSSGIKLLPTAVMIGIAFGLAYLCRPTFILWPVMIGTYLLGMSLYQRNKNPLIAASIVIAVVMSFVAAWTMRNVAQMGRPIWATTHGGYTLLLGNNESFYDYVQNPDKSGGFPFGSAWGATFFIDRWEQRFDSDPRPVSFWNPQTAILPSDTKTILIGEIDDDKLAYETAVATIKRRPPIFLAACIWRLKRLHSAFPLHTSERPSTAVFSVAVFYAVTMTLVLLGIWKLGKALFAPRWAASIALWAAIASVHTVYWTDMRMRAPVVPILSILAAASVIARPFAAGHNGTPVKTAVSSRQY